ncbi:MAG: hypothetical protein JSU86_16045 [Phycisphaerales bacterium]|nr:MAG: hypothetical protein JSU86_16045 [Phycisphaerales bacterium]
MPRRNTATIASIYLMLFLPIASAARGGGALPDNDIPMKALVDELARSMEDLVLEDLPRPYFIQYNAQDRITFNMRAAYGALLRSDRDRYRFITCRVRVGSPKLDNTNMGRGSGGRATLPLDDNQAALRHAIWQMTDSDYKHAVETLTRKQAFLKQKTVEDRPDDFSSARPVRAIQPSAEIAFDNKQWEDNVERLSARFKQYPKIQNSGVTFFAGAENRWIVNSEGTRLRTADTGVSVEIHAQLQAEEGMHLADELFYLGLQIDHLPTIEEMLAGIDRMCEKLTALSQAPVLEHYTGPVLFEPIAAGKVFQALLADGLCATPIPIGSGGWGDTSLEKKIGQRILPRSFNVYDDSGPQRFEGTILAGAYTYDDEAVQPGRVTLVEKGILKTLLAGRAPTRRIKKTTGHGRSGGYGDAHATIGCLYVYDDDGMSADELKEKLIQAVREEGLEFGLRIESMEAGGYGELGDPIYAYKVYVDDGREELIRGMEFLPTETRSLRRILAAGAERKVYNAPAGIPVSVIAPAIILEELELTKIEREFDKLPILKPPPQRTK